MHYNIEGYMDRTAGKAMGNVTPVRNKIRPLPKRDKIYDMTFPYDKTELPKPRNWDIFLHYAGYHNPDLGIWVKVTAVTEEEAKAAAMCQTVTSKKVEVSIVLRSK